VKKGSIQSGRDLAIASGTLIIAFSVITLILVPAMSAALPGVVSAADGQNCQISAMGFMGCDTELELPAGSVIWICQFLTYSDEAGDLIDIDLCNHDDWVKHGELIEELTGLENEEQWERLFQDMIYQEDYVKLYLQDEGFSVISCLDCDRFWSLVTQANECECPVKIAMYDCCCVISPIIPVFMY
jgi:hypothetical protein